MKRLAGILTVVFSFIAVQARPSDTNVLIIPSGDHRAGAIFFVDECLTRGLTNSISICDLRKWATNTIRVYQEGESKMAASCQSIVIRYDRVRKADIPEAIQSIQEHIPSCRSDKPIPFDGLDKLLEAYSQAWSVSKEEALRRLNTIKPDSGNPRVGFCRSTADDIEAVSISWYDYGVMVGPESFKPEWEHTPWYERKLADGIYLWHGYK